MFKQHYETNRCHAAAIFSLAPRVEIALLNTDCHFTGKVPDSSFPASVWIWFVSELAAMGTSTS